MKKRLLSLAMAVLMVFSLFPQTASAADVVAQGTCGDRVVWTLYTDGLLRIRGVGEMYDYNSSDYQPEYNKYKDEIGSIEIESGVTSIGSYAFRFTTARTVSIPEGVERIGEYAFPGSSMLEHLTIPGSVQSIGKGAFSNCYKLADVSVQEGVKTIGDEAFSECKNLASVTLPDSLESIGARVFYKLPSLVNVDLGNGLTSIGMNAFRNCTSLRRITIPDSVGSLGVYAFDGCTALESVVIGDGLTAIGDYTFNLCSALNDVSLGSGLESIGYRAFYACEALTRLILPDGLQTIGTNAFEQSGLQSIVIPDSVTSVGSGAFSLCWSLSSAVLGRGMTSVSDNLFFNCAKLRDIEIPDTITAIGSMAFYTCGLQSVTLPSSISYISSLAFASSALRSIVIPESVTEIREKTFTGCTSLNSVTLPDTLTSIGTQAFYNCTALERIEIPASVERVEEKAFEKCTGLKGVYVDDLAAWCAVDFVKGSNPLVIAHDLYVDEQLVMDLVIPEGVTEIGPYAFYCSSIQSINIPESVKTIGDYAFGSCSSLQSIDIPENVETLGACAFSSCTKIQSVVLPESVTTLGAGAFSKCTGLTDVQLSHGIEVVGDFAFEGCSELRSVDIPYGVVTIGAEAFYDCTMLMSVSIPKTVKTIGYSAFGKCLILRDVYYSGSEWGWKTIQIGGTNDELKNATIHYSSPMPPAIRFQPKDVSAKIGETVTFEITVVGENYTLQWEYSTDGGATWKASGSTSPTETCLLSGAGCDGWLYRCRVSDANGSELISNSAKITVLPGGVFITQQPQDCSGKPGDTAVFTVAAEGEGLTYQWQYKDVGGDWLNSSFKTASMSCKFTTARNGRQYRCVVTNASGDFVISEPATIRVSVPVITQQPQDVIGGVGTTASFSVAAEGEGLTYRWQYKNVGSDWANSSFKTASMSCKLKPELDGRQYRCVITDVYGNKVYTDAAAITVYPAMVITQQPQDYTGRVDATATFSVAVEGENLTYRWQYKDVGGKWTNSSFKTPTMSCKLTAERDGRQYRCLITDAYGNKLYSDAATMTVKLPPVITSQPRSVSSYTGMTATFTVAAEGEGLTYRWQYKDVGGVWTNSSFKTASMSCKITAARDGRQYRCVITDAWGNKVTSNPATIHVLG